MSMRELHLYVKIITERSRLDASAKEEVNWYSVSLRTQEERAVVMMVTVVSLFAVCWAPFHIVHMMIEYSEWLSFSFDGSSGSFPATMDSESLKCLAIHLGNQIESIY